MMKAYKRIWGVFVQVILCGFILSSCSPNSLHQWVRGQTSNSFHPIEHLNATVKSSTVEPGVLLLGSSTFRDLLPQTMPNESWLNLTMAYGIPSDYYKLISDGTLPVANVVYGLHPADLIQDQFVSKDQLPRQLRSLRICRNSKAQVFNNAPLCLLYLLEQSHDFFFYRAVFADFLQRSIRDAVGENTNRRHYSAFFPKTNVLIQEKTPLEWSSASEDSAEKLHKIINRTHEMDFEFHVLLMPIHPQFLTSMSLSAQVMWWSLIQQLQDQDRLALDLSRNSDLTEANFMELIHINEAGREKLLPKVVQTIEELTQ